MTVKKILDEMYEVSPIGRFWVSEELWDRLKSSVRAVDPKVMPLVSGMRIAVKEELTGEQWEVMKPAGHQC